MKPLKLFLLLCGIVLFTLLSCKQESLETDPAKAILGKWILIEKRGMGTIKVKPSGSYGEFLPNGVYRLYDALDKKMKYTIYYIADSTLNIRTVYDESDGMEIWEKSLFKFSDRNNILAKDISPWFDAMFDVYILKRIQ
ncbi:MAG: hypothetical protein HOO91_09180 [Bacteroidales bacterium]|nr:hypothetical protein [Bacteroidales bacterium]